MDDPDCLQYFSIIRAFAGERETIFGIHFCFHFTQNVGFGNVASSGECTVRTELYRYDNYSDNHDDTM